MRPKPIRLALMPTGEPFNAALRRRPRWKNALGNDAWTCHSSGVDRYGRTLATCSADDEDVGRWLVHEGWALAFRRYSAVYVEVENSARAGHRGLWKGAFIAPWAWRQRSVSTEVLGAASVPVDANRIFTGRTAGSPPTATCSIKEICGGSRPASITFRADSITKGWIWRIARPVAGSAAKPKRRLPAAVVRNSDGATVGR